MQEAGIDISGQRPKHVNPFLGQTFHRVMTVCDAANEECPYFPGAERIHWPFDDPSKFTGTHDERLEGTRRVRDQIRSKIDSFCEEHCVASQA